MHIVRTQRWLVQGLQKAYKGRGVKKRQNTAYVLCTRSLFKRAKTCNLQKYDFILQGHNINTSVLEQQMVAELRELCSMVSTDDLKVWPLTNFFSLLFAASGRVLLSLVLICVYVGVGDRVVVTKYFKHLYCTDLN